MPRQTRALLPVLFLPAGASMAAPCATCTAVVARAASLLWPARSHTLSTARNRRDELTGVPSILRYIARAAADGAQLYGSDPLSACQVGAAAVVDWRSYRTGAGRHLQSLEQRPPR